MPVSKWVTDAAKGMDQSRAARRSAVVADMQRDRRAPRVDVPATEDYRRVLEDEVFKQASQSQKEYNTWRAQQIAQEPLRTVGLSTTMMPPDDWYERMLKYGQGVTKTSLIVYDDIIPNDPPKPEKPAKLWTGARNLDLE